MKHQNELLRKRAKQEAEDFLKNDQEYRMGYIDAELPHPLTRNLSQTYQKDTVSGVRLLFSVDAEMAQRAAKALETPEYAEFAQAVRGTLEAGGRVIFSGCGSSGRLSMRLEQSWRNAIQKLCLIYPALKEALQAKTEAVGNIMTGGDYAVIRAAESFEDSTRLGEAQAAEWNLTERDLLVGITATGETTSILGTAIRALQDGAQVYMLICSDPTPLPEKMERARRVYPHPNCRTLSLPCGPMALTGSTRMQSSSLEQFAAAVALEWALNDLLRSLGVEEAIVSYGEFGQEFARMTKRFLEEPCLRLVSECTEKEEAIYRKGGLVTLYSDQCLLDVLTDTTERAPTFMTPPFRSSDMTDQEESWAFVKNPTCNTEAAWEKCFLRAPRCLEWNRDRYRELGLTEQQIDRIPDIRRKALMKYAIGWERMPQREKKPSLAMWVDTETPPQEFFSAAKAYGDSLLLTPSLAEVSLKPTHMDLFDHLALKMILNALSTGVMARMGRITGNWMTSLAMSNKKLMDRSARIVSDVCSVPYELALEEIFYSRALVEAEGLRRSPAEDAISRLSAKQSSKS